MLKEPIRTDDLIEQKPRAGLSGKEELMRRGSATEFSVSTFSLGNLNLNFLVELKSEGYFA